MPNDLSSPASHLVSPAYFPACAHCSRHDPPLVLPPSLLILPTETIRVASAALDITQALTPLHPLPLLCMASSESLSTPLLQMIPTPNVLQVGFRQSVLKGRNILINNRAVTFRGVNRHEHDPDTGKAISIESMLKVEGSSPTSGRPGPLGVMQPLSPLSIPCLLCPLDVPHCPGSFGAVEVPPAPQPVPSVP